MNQPTHMNYTQIAEAIEYLQQNVKEQLTLEEVADKKHFNPSYLQKLFNDWAGVSPKKFMQYISLQYAKRNLDTSQSTLFDSAYQKGFSGIGRLHDLFVKIEVMTPQEHKNKGENLSINYSFAESIFGSVLVAATYKGICYMGFADDKHIAFQN